MNFDQAFEALIGHEGGLSMDPKDRGNWTGGRVGVGTLKGSKYGVSAASYPALDIANLTLADAKAIYLKDYWGAAGCDAVPDGIKFDLFDMAVNSGQGNAIKVLQRAVDALADGALGPRTLQALNSMAAPRLVARFNGHRLEFMTNDIVAWPSQGRGWAKRIANNLKEA